MEISMFVASVPILIRSLNNLVDILKKAEAHAEENGIRQEVLIECRLFPNMLSLRNQVYIASDTAKGCGARLAGMTPPAFEDTEKTFPELIARIHKTIAFLETLSPDQIDGSEERTIVLQLRSSERVFNGMPYLLNYALPNLFFHITTAYDILRHNGVPLGKSDYLGQQ